MTEILVKEQFGSEGDIFTYINKSGQNEIKQIKVRGAVSASLRSLGQFFKDILLPYGYPSSVSDDYTEYQIWDTAQCFCSTIIGAFSTRAILKGVGVGNQEINALSAAVTWILKDGSGMIGRIVFAWWKGNDLDSDCKKWRFFADVINDMAMTVELVLPYFSQFSMHLLCLTSTMKSLVGIAGGATRASITNHQAIRDNTAEVSAKDGTQECLVNLFGSILSIYLLNVFNESNSDWLLMFLLMFFHLLTNYWAVKALIFKTFNKQRLALVLRSYFNLSTVLSPQKINENESVLLGFGSDVCQFCGFEILAGVSLKSAAEKFTAADFKEILNVYENQDYLLLVDLQRRTIYIVLSKGESTEKVIAAHFHAVCLAIATCLYNGIQLDIYDKRQRNHRTPLDRLHSFMKAYQPATNLMNIPHHYLVDFQDFVKQEYSMFHTAMQINGWSLGSHSLNLGQYRCDWKHCGKNN
ncbi:unnamed protein product [Phyllotreta striolata]|uniref:Uncharacterized protein n=1 Tax=Phyllotreta striolata TaxID=444603 RepID=A0A9N9TR65_PHYSR|nr:unnamed protein product [Phyllotreta striolata]